VCADPVIRCSTKDLSGVFAGMPAVSIGEGHAVNTGGGSPTAATLLQFQCRSAITTFLPSGTVQHIVGTNQKGFLYVTELSARQDDERGATVSLEYAAHSADGTTAPLAFDDTAALSGSPNFNGIWYMGPVYMGQLGSSLAPLPGVQSVSFRPGVDYR